MLDVLRRLTSVTTAFALSGSPALIAACMTLCLQGPVAANSQASGAAHHGHDADARPVAPPTEQHDASHDAAHARHAAAAADHIVVEHEHGIGEHEHGRASSADRSSAPAPDAFLSSSCDDCCPDADAVVAAAAGAERASARLLSTPPAVSIGVLDAHLIAARATPPPDPLVSPPLPVRAPLALRI